MSEQLLNELRTLRGDIHTTGDVLWEFAGERVWQQAQSAVQHIAYLRRAVNIAQYNEKCASDVIQQDRREIARLRRLLEARGIDYGEEARQTERTSGPQREREGYEADEVGYAAGEGRQARG